MYCILIIIIIICSINIVDILLTHVHIYIHTHTQINEAMYLPEMNGQPMIVINVPDKGKADNIIGKCMLVC
jgi:hypothetical protein